MVRSSTSRRGLLLWRTLVVVIAITATLAVVVVRWQSQRGPVQVRFEPAVVEIGDARQGETISREVVVVNRTDQPIKIIGLHSTCHCTALPDDLLGLTIPQSGQREMPLVLKTGNAEGRTSGAATIYYRLGASTSVNAASVTIGADVLPDYRIDPPIIDFGTITDNRPVSRGLSFLPAALRDVQATRASSSHPEFEVEIPTPSADSSVGTIFVRFVPPAEPTEMQFSGVIKVETTSPRAPVASILARARYESPVRATPSALVFLYPRDCPTRREFELHSGIQSRIEELSCDGSELSVCAVTSGLAHVHVVEAKLADGQIKVDVHRSIRARLAIPEGSGSERLIDVSLPVHVLVTKGEGS